MHNQELEVITEFCGKEKKSLNEALKGVRTKYRAKVDQYNTNIEVIFCGGSWMANHGNRRWIKRGRN